MNIHYHRYCGVSQANPPPAPKGSSMSEVFWVGFFVSILVLLVVTTWDVARIRHRIRVLELMQRYHVEILEKILPDIR